MTTKEIIKRLLNGDTKEVLNQTNNIIEYLGISDNNDNIASMYSYMNIEKKYHIIKEIRIDRKNNILNVKIVRNLKLLKEFKKFL